MNLQQLIKNMDSLSKKTNVPKDELILSAGGALVLLNIRKETDDLDVEVSKEYYDKLKIKYPTKTLSGVKHPVIEVDAVSDVHLTTDELETMVVRGIRIYTVDKLIEQKKKLFTLPNRSTQKKQTDLSDIEGLLKLK